MKDYLYLDDYINLYSFKKKKIISIKPYKDTLRYGHIINRNKFIKIFNKIIKEQSLNNNIFVNKIVVIINRTYSEEDKLVIKDALEELNYHNIKFEYACTYLNMKQNKVFINYNFSYFSIIFINKQNKTKLYNYDINGINEKLIMPMLKIIKKDKIYIYGKNYNKLIDIIKNINIPYYFYDISENLILNQATKKM